MTGETQVPIQWFGEFEPKVGREFDLIVRARVSKIEQDQIDVTDPFSRTGPETLGGETYVTLVISELRVPVAEVAS